jgi:hypothetical protein
VQALPHSVCSLTVAKEIPPRQRWRPSKDTDFRNHLITVDAAYTKNGKAHGVPMNEVLTEALRTTKIDELTGLVFSNRRQVPGISK